MSHRVRQIVELRKADPDDDGSRWVVDTDPSWTAEHAIRQAKAALRVHLLKTTAEPLPELRMVTYYVGSTDIPADLSAF